MADRDAELLAAAREGDIGRVARWLRLGARVDGAGRSATAPVAAAASEGHLWVVNKLLDAGAEPSRGALLGAARGGHERVVQKLLDAGADVNARAEDGGASALALAAGGGHADVVRLLLQRGADPDAVDARGETALDAAQSHGQAGVARALAEVTASPQQFFRAVAYGNLDGVRRGLDRYLHARGARGCSPVLLAAQHAQFEALKLLVFRGADVGDRDESGWTALHFAAQTGDAAAVAFLLAERADPSAADEHGLLPVAVAASYGHVDAVRELLARDAARELVARVGGLDKRSVLHHAAASASPGAAATLELLLAATAGAVDVDAADANGWTALHLATQSGSALLVDLLLARGADANVRTAWDCSPGPARVQRTDTALHLAVQHAHLGIVRLLLARPGVDPDAADVDSRSPLLQAVASGQTEIALALVGGGANPDAGDDDGRTPLLEAARAGSHELVQALLQHGARVDVMSKLGETPVKYASSDDMRAVLLVYQASQRFHDRCAALLSSPAAASVGDVVELVPLLTSVYDLRLLLAVARTVVRARARGVVGDGDGDGDGHGDGHGHGDGDEQQRAVVADLLKTAFARVLAQKLVLDDDACVFFRLVLEHCAAARLVTANELLRWKVRASKVHMEGAAWVTELKRQVHQNSRRLGLHDRSIRLAAEGMRRLHARVAENRAAVAHAQRRVEQLQQQVAAGRQLLAGLSTRADALSDGVQALDARLGASEAHVVALAAGLQSVRGAYAARLKQERKTRMLKMGCGLVASLVGFAFAPVLKDVFDSVIDLTNPVEVYEQVFPGADDVVAFLADQAAENVLAPAVEAQLVKCAVSKQQFETALRQEIAQQRPELVDECERRGLALALDGAGDGDGDADADADADGARAFAPELDAADEALRETIAQLEAAAQALAAAATDPDASVSDAARPLEPARPPSLRALPSANAAGAEDASNVSTASASTLWRRSLSSCSSLDAEDSRAEHEAPGDARVEFVDDLRAFPFHAAVHSSGGDLDAFLQLARAADAARADPNAAMTLALARTTASDVHICAAEYAYLLGHRAAGDWLAAKMRTRPSVMAGVDAVDGERGAVSVTLLQDADEFQFVSAVQECGDDVHTLALLAQVIDEEEDPVEAVIHARVEVAHAPERVVWTAVQLACHLGHVAIVKHLLVERRVATVVKSVVVMRRAMRRARERLSAHTA